MTGSTPNLLDLYSEGTFNNLSTGMEHVVRCVCVLDGMDALDVSEWPVDLDVMEHTRFWPPAGPSLKSESTPQPLDEVVGLVRSMVGKRSADILALAKDAAARQSEKTEEDIEQWIGQIVDDVKDATD